MFRLYHAFFHEVQKNMIKKKWRPLKFGILFGIGGFLYTFGFIFFALVESFGAIDYFCSFTLASYLFLAIVSLVAIFVNRENTLTKRLIITGFIFLILSFLFLLAQNVSMVPSFILFYPSLTLFMMGFHYLSPSPGRFSRYIGLVLAISISFIGIILFMILFEYPYHLYLLLAISTATLCIISGFHSSKMLEECNHE